jgi:hypothetical protein
MCASLSLRLFCQHRLLHKRTATCHSNHSSDADIDTAMHRTNRTRVVTLHCSVHGFIEPVEFLENETGLLVAHIFIPDAVAVRHQIDLWMVNIHDFAVVLRAGHIAYVLSHDNDAASVDTATTNVVVNSNPNIAAIQSDDATSFSDVANSRLQTRLMNSHGLSDVAIQTDPDPRFPHEYLHVAVPESQLPQHARFPVGHADHPNSSEQRRQLRQVPWANTMLYPPPNLLALKKTLRKYTMPSYWTIPVSTTKIKVVCASGSPIGITND